MREFYFPYSDALKTGLRRDSRTVRNTPALRACLNAKPTEFGLKAYQDIRDDLDGPSVSWPFPVLFRGKKTTLLVYETSVYEVDESTSPWGTSQLSTYNVSDPEEADTITAGGVWQMADFWDSWLLYNGSCVVYKHLLSDAQRGYTPVVQVQDTVWIETGCDHSPSGRLIIGGFDPDHFWGEDWQELWTRWASAQPDPVSRTYHHLLDSDMPMQGNFVAWSSIGGGDLMYLFYPHLATSGPIGRELAHSDDIHSDEDPVLFDYLRRNECGFAPMTFSGDVLCVKTLGNNVAVYGENGISALIKAGTTFGTRPILSTGVAGRGAVGGNEYEHVIVDESGVVWVLGLDLDLKRLGYSEYIEPLLDGEVIVSFDPQEHEYYIGRGTDGAGTIGGYVLTKSGLGKIHDIPTSVVPSPNGLSGVVEDDSSATLTLATDVVDFGNRGIKNLTSIQLGLYVSTDTAVTVSVYYRMNRDDSFSVKSSVPVNDQGFAYPNIAGVEFRVLVNIAAYANAEVDSIDLYWKLVDKRNIRGPYAAQVESRPGG